MNKFDKKLSCIFCSLYPKNRRKSQKIEEKEEVLLYLFIKPFLKVKTGQIFSLYDGDLSISCLVTSY